MPRARNSRFPNVREVSPYHVHWRSITTYTATYKNGKKGKGKKVVIIRTINKPPPPQKELQLAGDALRLFTRTKLTKSKRKAIVIMATTKTKKSSKKSKTREKPVEDETLEELTDLEEIEEEDEETTDDDETTTDSTDDEDSDDEDSDDDEDDDEEVAPPPKSKKKKKKSSRAKDNGKVGTQEIAEAAGVDSRTLRMVLRKHEVEKDPESGRYEWESLEHKTVKQILKWIAKGEAKDIKQESLDKLKEKKAKKEGTKVKKKNKKKKKETEEEDDE